MTATRLTPTVPTASDAHEDDSLKKEKADKYAMYLTVAKRLEVHFGTGENPQLRRKLYQRIQRCAIAHGPECYSVIRDCVAKAQTADQPDRYFCTAVTSELKQLDYWQEPTDF